MSMTFFWVDLLNKLGQTAFFTDILTIIQATTWNHH